MYVKLISCYMYRRYFSMALFQHLIEPLDMTINHIGYLFTVVSLPIQTLKMFVTVCVTE